MKHVDYGNDPSAVNHIHCCSVPMDVWCMSLVWLLRIKKKMNIGFMLEL